MGEPIWRAQAGGNIAEYYTKCSKDYYRCPLEILEYVWIELVGDVLFHVNNNEILQFVKFGQLVLCLFLISFLYLILNHLSQSGDVKRKLSQESSLILLQELENKLDVLVCDMDRGHNNYLENLNIRMSNALNEFTYMRRCIMIFLNVDDKIEPFRSLDSENKKIDGIPIHKQELAFDKTMNKMKLKYKLSSKHVSLSTDDHVRRINECFKCINDLMHLNKLSLLWLGLIVKRLYSVIKNTISRNHRKKDLAAVSCAIKELRNIILRDMALINDEHSSLMNEPYQSIRRNIGIMEDRDMKIADKFDIILCTIENWLELLTSKLEHRKRFKVISLCNPVLLSLKRLRKRFCKEIQAIRLVKEIVIVNEASEPDSTDTISHRAVRNAYSKAVITIFGEPGTDEFEKIFRKNNNTCYDSCEFFVKNVLRKAKSLSALICVQDQKIRRPKSIFQQFYEFEMQSEILQEEGEQKKFELKNILARLDHIDGKHIVFSFPSLVKSEFSETPSISLLSKLLRNVFNALAFLRKTNQVSNVDSPHFSKSQRHSILRTSQYERRLESDTDLRCLYKNSNQEESSSTQIDELEHNSKSESEESSASIYRRRSFPDSRC